MMQIETMSVCVYRFPFDQKQWEGVFRSALICELEVKLIQPGSSAYADIYNIFRVTGTPQQIRNFDEIIVEYFPEVEKV